MPSQPAWFHRLDEILGALRSMTSTHLDRAAVEKLFLPAPVAAPTWWREALSDRHGRGRRQRVAGALRPARKNKNAAKIDPSLNVKNPASIRSGGAVVNELTSCGFGHRLGICKGDEPNMPTSARQARLFRNGRNQAVRIPRDFELATDEVTIYREDHRLVIEPVERSPSLAEILSSLAPLDEHFASVDDPPAKPEEIF